MTNAEYKNRKYSIEPYNPEWKDIFASKAAALKQVFQDNAISIEHIGSTSVPDLAGKPTIDILITVPDIKVADRLPGELTKLEYKFLGEYVNPGAYLFVQEVNNTRLVNLHIYEISHSHVKEMLGLRNYLRSHPEIVSQYSKLKFDLVSKYPDDYGQYRKYKDDWMNELKVKVSNQIERGELLGKLVSLENEENWWRQDLFENRTRRRIPPELEIVSPPPAEEGNYNCYVYSLGLQNDDRFLGNKGWDFTRNLGKVFDEMIALKVIETIKKPKAASLVVYRANDNQISHVGIIENEKVVISKWSWGPLLRHEIFDVPDHYGDTVEFYTPSQEATDFVLRIFTSGNILNA